MGSAFRRGERKEIPACCGWDRVRRGSSTFGEQHIALTCVLEHYGTRGPARQCVSPGARRVECAGSQLNREDVAYTQANSKSVVLCAAQRRLQICRPDPSTQIPPALSQTRFG